MTCTEWSFGCGSENTHFFDFLPFMTYVHTFQFPHSVTFVAFQFQVWILTLRYFTVANKHGRYRFSLFCFTFGNVDYNMHNWGDKWWDSFFIIQHGNHLQNHFLIFEERFSYTHKKGSYFFHFRHCWNTMTIDIWRNYFVATNLRMNLPESLKNLHYRKLNICMNLRKKSRCGETKNSLSLQNFSWNEPEI